MRRPLRCSAILLSSHRTHPTTSSSINALKSTSSAMVSPASPTMQSPIEHWISCPTQGGGAHASAYVRNKSVWLGTASALPLVSVFIVSPFVAHVMGFSCRARSAASKVSEFRENLFAVVFGQRGDFLCVDCEQIFACCGI